MTTEAEAKRTLWCPMKFAADWDDARCMGAECAAWRWDDSFGPWRVVANSAERPESVPPDLVYVPASGSLDERSFISACWAEPESAYRARREGFCGLGGKP